jgi:RNA polymerase sigma-70 factor (ECF subfamily)
LLARIRDPKDGRAWAEFVDLYAPLVYGYARRQGLQDADAADLTQDVLRAVAGAAGRLEYDPGRGRFRGWLFTVVRNKLRNFQTARGRREQGTGDTAAHERLQQAPAPEVPGDWDREYERRLFAWAAERVRGGFAEPTWQAFWRTAVEGQKPRDVAAGLGLSVGAVYVARSRVLARLRKEIDELQAQ